MLVPTRHKPYKFNIVSGLSCPILVFSELFLTFRQTFQSSEDWRLPKIGQNLAISNELVSEDEILGSENCSNKQTPAARDRDAYTQYGTTSPQHAIIPHKPGSLHSSTETNDTLDTASISMNINNNNNDDSVDNKTRTRMQILDYVTQRCMMKKIVKNREE